MAILTDISWQESSSHVPRGNRTRRNPALAAGQRWSVDKKKELGRRNCGMCLCARGGKSGHDSEKALSQEFSGFGAVLYHNYRLRRRRSVPAAVAHPQLGIG